MNLSYKNIKEPASHCAKPLVTIAIPTFNRAGFLRSAIDSAIAQSYEPIEIVVSDNASTDETAKILASYQDTRFRYIRQESNIGLIANWNACLKVAQGEYFLMLSDDDQLAPNAIQDLVDGFGGYEEDNSKVTPTDIAFVYGHCEINNKTSNTVLVSKVAPKHESSENYRIGVLRRDRVSYPSATLFRTKDAVTVNGYNPQYGGGPDVIMAFEISCLYPTVAFTETTTTFYLFHPENYTSRVGISVLVDTTSRLSQLSVLAADPSDTKLILHVKRIGILAQASTLVYTCVHRRTYGSITLRQVCVKVWKHRKIFTNIECIVLLFKGFIKLTFSGIRMNIKNPMGMDK